MKRSTPAWVFGIVTLLLLPFALGSQSSKSEPHLPMTVLSSMSTTAGCYALIQADYPFVNLDGERRWIKALFKLDTATGEIFECGGSQIRGGINPKYPNSVQVTTCREFEGELPLR